MKDAQVVGQVELFCARKVCLGCEQAKPEDEFARRGARRLPRCKPCMTAYMKAWHERHPGYAKQQNREWYAENGAAWNERRKRLMAKPRKVAPDAERRALLERYRQANPDKQFKPNTVSDGLDKVYFVQVGEDGPVKIGWTKSAMRQRLHQLQNGNPIAMFVRGVMDGTREVEADLHKVFSHLGIQGTEEWFRPEPELMEFVQAFTVLPQMKISMAGYRGVRKGQTEGSGYHAKLRRRGHSEIYLGTFKTPEDAARAYDAKAREIFGADALLNFPRMGETHWRDGRNGRRPRKVDSV